MISSYLELLERRCGAELDDKARTYLEFAAGGAKRLAGMVRGILDYSRLERSEGREPVAMDLVLGQATDNLRRMIADSDAEIVHGPLPTVSASPSQILLVLQNLIGNAIKYRDPVRPPRIVVKAVDAAGEWIFTVADNGIGIAANHFARVFELFQRLDPRGSSGLGIGLATCQKIIEHHGGRVWLESTPDVGSTFFFTLPKMGA